MLISGCASAREVDSQHACMRAPHKLADVRERERENTTQMYTPHAAYIHS